MLVHSNCCTLVHSKVFNQSDEVSCPSHLDGGAGCVPAGGTASELFFVVQGLQGTYVEHLAPFGTVTIPVTLLPLQPGVQTVAGLHAYDGEGKVVSCAPTEIYVHRNA